MKKKNILLLGLPVIALILELLPWGVVLRFMGDPAGAPTIVRTSYVDMLAFGYGNVAPLITAVLTCMLLVLIVLYRIKQTPKIRNIVKNMALVAAVISVFPVFFSSYSLIGGLITVCLALETMLLYPTKKPEN